MNSKEKTAKVRTPIPGPRSISMIDRWGKVEARTTGFQAPIAVESAQGAVIWDVDGNAFIDWTSGVLVTNVGHCHPKLVKRVQEASAKVMNCYEYPTPYRVRAAEMLMESAPDHLETCFFFSTGGEAMDALIRIMKRRSGCYEVIGFFGGFHGRLYAPASAGGISKIKSGLGPAMPGVIRAPFPYCYRCPFNKHPDSCGFLCLEFLDDLVAANSTGAVAGLVIEPYLGTAGFVFPPDGYLSLLEQWARRNQFLFGLDEVQSSFGRTGKMWYMEWDDLKPDIVSTGKGVGSGIPQSAILATSDIMSCLGRGDLSSTAGGNPVSCAATIAVFEIMSEESLCERSQRLGSYMKEELLGLIDQCSYLGDVRGKGLVIGLEIVEDKTTKEPSNRLCREIVLRCAEKGLLVGIVGVFGNVIRVAPPLVITEQQVEESLCLMKQVLLSL
jgi:4-aminobutyrate aminotransferase-like enzyme